MLIPLMHMETEILENVMPKLIQPAAHGLHAAL